MSRAIPLFKVHMPQTVVGPLLETLFSGYVSEGPRAREFEQMLQNWLGNPTTALVNSGTSALELAVRLAGAGDGDEVVSTPMTCLATNEAIANNGASIRWADVDPETGNIDPASVEENIGPKTKAVMIVHWASIPAQIDSVRKIAAEHGLPVIEDAAHALGATYKGVKIGNHSDFVCFSFQAIKHLTTVDGGALACRRREDYERTKLLRWYGSPRLPVKKSTYWDFDVTESGYKKHMNDVTATIGIEQMKYVDGVIAKHRHNGEYLQQNLRGIAGVELMRIDSYIAPSYLFFTLKLDDPASREKFSAQLTQQGVENSVVHVRNDTYTMFKDIRKKLPGVDDFSSRMLGIPCGWWLSLEDLSYIVDTIVAAAAKL